MGKYKQKLRWFSFNSGKFSIGLSTFFLIMWILETYDDQSRWKSQLN